ncbi:hypothetical protein HY479_04040 [Candidatus Uhrbacteria bacterium]|nr:hypothetical protein [Candidatus Uhrbacteria bacterium]
MPLLIATCGPTAIGKTHQMHRLIASDHRRFAAVLSVTTRQRRSAEDGEWYRLVTRESLASLDANDVVSNVEFRGERYVLLRSEIEKALARAPIAFMAIVPSVILLMRERNIPHACINCRVGNFDGYVERLKRRGFSGEALEAERQTARAFAYPPADPAWPQVDVEFGSDADDDARFTDAVRALSGKLFPQHPV